MDLWLPNGPPTDALDKCFHVDFFHWFNGYNDLFQKESWRILNGVSQGHSYFDVFGNITNFLKSYMGEYENTKDKGYISLPLGNHSNARLGNKRSDKDLELFMPLVSLCLEFHFYITEMRLE